MYNSLSYKTKQFFSLLIKLAIVIGCGYFIYQKLIESEQLGFSSFLIISSKNGLFSSKIILFLLIFTFFNWFLEILKWKKLASYCLKISYKSAIIQSLSSLTASLITPNRIGEYGAKALFFMKPLRKKIVGLNLVGNFYQMLATLIFGSVGFVFFVLKHDVVIDFHRIFKVLLLGAILISVILFGAKHFKNKEYSFEKARTYISEIPFSLNLKVGLLSFLRFMIFSHQFYFLFFIFKVDISYIDAITAICSVYFISSIVPMLSLFDVILKGTVAIWVFTYLNVAPITIVSITTIMWVFNFVLPSIIGSYFVLTFKPQFSK
jgi:hypothetical protein